MLLWWEALRFIGASANSGLEQIHRLRNAGIEVTISLHIDGVGAQNVPAGIYYILDRAADAGAAT